MNPQQIIADLKEKEEMILNILNDYMKRHSEIEHLLKDALDGLEVCQDSITQSNPHLAMNICASRNKVFTAWRKVRARNKTGLKLLKKAFNLKAALSSAQNMSKAKDEEFEGKYTKFEDMSEILKIIEAGLEGNKKKLKSYALLLKSKIKDKRLAKALQDRIDGKKGNLVHAKSKLKGVGE